MQILKYIDTPFTWAVAGFAIGIAFGVDTGINSIGIWLVTIGLFGFLLYLRLHGPAEEETEGRLFAAVPVFIVAWVVGFVVRGFVLA